MTRVQLPETPSEAIGFDRRNASYRERAGLCPFCAAYAAHRHACGWLVDPRPPCALCRPLVDGFPLPTADPAWRKYPRGRVPARLCASLTTSTARRGTSTSPTLTTTSTDKLAGRRVFGVVPASAHALAEVTR